MKRLLIYMLVLVLSFSLIGCTNTADRTQPNTNGQQNSAPQQDDSKNADGSIIYENAEYGFSFSLPESWKDYKLVTGKWEGLSIDGKQGEKVVDNGPMISIRHPQWTTENPRQDIPIMIFTTEQWSNLQQEKFHIGAAPIGPSELGHNKSYVFALPARYNFAFQTGYEEVEEMLQNKPLHIIE